MKKMLLSVAAVALCGAALAGQTHGYAYFSNYAPVDPDPSSTAGQTYYSCYIITSDTVASPAGLETWLTENGGITRENIAAKGTTEGYMNLAWDGIGQYSWQVDDVTPLTDGGANKYAVILAATEKTAEAPDFAYEIMKGTSESGVGTTWTFDDKDAGSVTWTSAPVPEPTSGLLVLLGIAGLALKRKRT